MAIGEVSQVLPGFSTGSAVEHDPRGTHQLVQSRHLTPGVPYRYREEDAFRINPGRRVDRFLLNVGDVLFMSRGTRNVSTWLEAIPEASLATTSFYVIRPTSELDSAYLTWYLNQPMMQRRIGEIRTGAAAPIVQRSALVALGIPVPPLEDQRRIGEVGALMLREQALRAQLARKADQLHGMTSEGIARALTAHAHRDFGED